MEPYESKAEVMLAYVIVMLLVIVALAIGVAIGGWIF